MKTLAASLMTAAFLFLLAVPASAGWIETDRDGGRTLFSDGKIKDGGKGTWNVFDTRSGELTLVDDERKIFTREKIDAFCRAIRSASEEAMSRMSPEERTMMEQMTGVTEEPGADAEKPTVSISSLGPGGIVADFETEKFQVKVDGVVYEELWIGTSAPVLEELDLQGLQRYQKEMSGCLQHAGPFASPAGAGPEESTEYQQLLGTGWVMRAVEYDENGKPVSAAEVIRLEKQDIPPSEFFPPSDYRQVTVNHFMTGE